MGCMLYFGSGIQPIFFAENCSSYSFICIFFSIFASLNFIVSNKLARNDDINNYGSI